MSDDGEDEGEYEDLGIDEEPADDGLSVEADEADVVGLDEDAAGTDEDDEDEDVDEVDEDYTEPVENPTPKARPERQKTDPILRMSNNPRTVRVVAPEDRVTDNRLHKSEAAFVLAMRSQQIAKYATMFTDGGALHDPFALAYKELYDRRCPFILRRPIGTGSGGEQVVEEWVVREMVLPPLTPPVALGAPSGGPGVAEARAPN
jgi:hypothetical protein